MLFRLVTPLVVAYVLLSAASPAKAGEIGDISPDIFQCMKRNTSSGGGWIVYNGDNEGTIVAYAHALFGGEAGRVDFTYNSDSRTLSISNPGGIGGDQIEGGLRDTANKCRSGQLS